MHKCASSTNGWGVQCFFVAHVKFNMCFRCSNIFSVFCVYSEYVSYGTQLLTIKTKATMQYHQQQHML